MFLLSLVGALVIGFVVWPILAGTDPVFGGDDA